MSTCQDQGCEAPAVWPLTVTARDADGVILSREDVPLCDEHIFDAVGWGTDEDGNIDYTLEGDSYVDLGVGPTVVEWTRRPMGNGHDRVNYPKLNIETTKPTLNREELLDALAEMLEIQR